MSVLAFDLHTTSDTYEVRLGGTLVQSGTLDALRVAGAHSQSPIMYLMEVLAQLYPKAEGRSLTIVPA